jgi:hypothetical protein
VKYALPMYPEFARANNQPVVSWDRAPYHLDAFGSPLHRHVFRDAIATRGSSSVLTRGRCSSSRLPRGWRSCLADANWRTGTGPGGPPRRPNPGRLIFGCLSGDAFQSCHRIDPTQSWRI